MQRCSGGEEPVVKLYLIKIHFLLCFDVENCTRICCFLSFRVGQKCATAHLLPFVPNNYRKQL